MSNRQQRRSVDSSALDPRLQSTFAQLQQLQPRNGSPSTANPSTQYNIPIAPTPHQYPAIQPNWSNSPQPQAPSFYHQPQTPKSGGNASDHEGESGGNGPNTDPKRARACEACRGLKVRCDPEPGNPSGACKRCNKAKRPCVVSVPTRKRQKKTDSRVAELEKKIDALTQSLHASGKVPSPPVAGGGGGENGNSALASYAYQQVSNGHVASPQIPRPDTARMYGNDYNLPTGFHSDSSKQSGPPMVMAGQKRKLAEAHGAVPDTYRKRSFDASGEQVAVFSSVKPQQKQRPITEYADVIDRGLITTEMANTMFDCYVQRMAPSLPAVVFAPGTSAAEIRKHKPTLFLAILASSCGMNYPELQSSLTKEVMRIYADRIICNGEKTLELIQALHVSTLWYWPPEHFEELRFYQLIHIAAVMAIDVGMGRKNRAKATGLWRENAWRRTPFPDPESIEARRSWLACYFLCCNASMGLRRPNLLRWSHFMDDCVMVLENSPEAVPSDKVLCQWIRSQHIAEEVGSRFSMDDPVANVSISDPKVQHALMGFERDLERWKEQIPTDLQSPTLIMTVHVINLYMHEVAMHVDHNVDEFKPPFTEESLHTSSVKPEPLSTQQIDAISTCLVSADGILQTFLTLDTDTIRCLPVANYVRVFYALIVLMKMYNSAAKPDSELGKVFNKDEIKVERYLDGLVENFRAAAAENKSRPAAKFMMILTTIKTWFHRHPDGKLPASRPTEGLGAVSGLIVSKAADNPVEQSDPPVSHQPQRTPSGYATNTPLHVLSEAATGNQSSSSTTQAPSDWNQQQYPAYDPAIMNQSMAGMTGTMDPFMDLKYGIGDGFEQAMGYTLGVGDYSGYFNDDAFFQSLTGSLAAPNTNGF